MPAISYRQFISRNGPAKNVSVYLCHGSNEELKTELFTMLRKKYAIELDDPFRLVRLDNDDFDADPGRLADELGAISMFGGSRLVHAKTSARVAERILRQALETPGGDWTLVIDAPDLGDAPWLPQAAAEAGVLAIMCGDEHAGDFHAFVASEFAKAGLACDEAALEMLILLVGDQRAAIRGEIEKLAALLGPSARVEERHIREAVADASSMLADEVASAAIAGDSDCLARALDRLKITGSDPVQALGAAHWLALNLHRAKIRQWGGRSDPHAPSWSAADSRSLIRSLGAAVHQTRMDGPNAALLAERALVALGRTARLRKR
jgi:DNA polymerase III subunit delta